MFDEAKPVYDHAIEKSGYKHKLAYNTCKKTPKPKRNRRKRCIFYNPPYCQSVKNNFGRAFLSLIDKHFGADHPYHPIFNRSTVKISYSCMPNVKSIIKAHNRKILATSGNSSDGPARTCNCVRGRTCPLGGQCLTRNVVYEASVHAKNRTMIYIGSTGNDFKSRFNTHNSSFNNRGQNETRLSKHIWELKDENTNYSISWRILVKVKGGGESARNVCSTCNSEKIEIARADKRTLLNKRSELTSACLHFRKLYFIGLPRKKKKPGTPS